MFILKIKKLPQKYSAVGFLGLVLLVIRRSHLFEYFVVFYFYKMPLKSLIKDVNYPSNASLKIIWSVDELSDLLEVQEKRDVFLSRLENGIFATVVYFNDIPVGYVWGQVNAPHYEERYGFLVDFEEHDVYSFDSFINTGYRGLGLRKYLLKEFINFALYKLGKLNMTAIIEKDNLNSIKVHEGMGYRRANLQVAFKIFSRDFQFVLRKYK